jgi:D-amino peptidase
MRMDVFISIDMEGIAGIATREQCRRGADDYAMGRRLMTAEANAAIAGAADADADHIVVRDAHGDMANLIPDDLDRRAELIFGSPSALSMMEGIDRRDFDVALFIGYHAGAGVGDGVLAHTYSGASFYDVRIDGQTMTETELNARLAGLYGVPIGLVTGDDRICELAEQRLDGVRTVAVKRGHGVNVTASMHPEAACEAIREATSSVVTRANDLTPFTADGPFHLEVDLTDLRRAELCAMPPGVEREGRTVRCTADGYLDAFRWLRSFVYLAAAAT